MARCGIDVDGVLALFDKAFTQVLIKTSGKDLFPAHPYAPPCWNWCEPLGYSKEEESAAWDAVKASKDFWRNLDTYPETESVIDRLWTMQKQGHDVYFITNRMGINPKRQTEDWLNDLTPTLWPSPTVLVSAHKGLSAAALELTHYIDDKPSNCTDVVKAMGVKCRTYLLDRTWNQEGAGTYVPRLKSVHEMLDVVEGKVPVGV